MFLSSLKPNRAAAAGALAVGIAIAASSVGIVRAGIVNPDKSKTFTCSSGTACVTGNSTGSSTYGVYGESTGADGVHGVTKSTNGNSAVAGIASGTSGNAHGVYGRSANGDGVYGVTTKTTTRRLGSTAPPAMGGASSASQAIPPETTPRSQAWAMPRRRASSSLSTPKPVGVALSTPPRTWLAAEASAARPCTFDSAIVPAGTSSAMRRSQPRQRSRTSALRA